MRQKFARLCLKLMGWEINFDEFPRNQSYVCIGAPHTSNMDGVVVLLARAATDLPFRYIAKQELFKGPFGGMLKRMGGIGIDRKSPGGLIDKMAALFDTDEPMVMVMAPEGTRVRTEYWKSGFYRVALKAGVPVGMGFMNYKTKKGGIHPELIHLSGDVKADMDKFRAFYADSHGYNPEYFGPVRLKEEETGLGD